MGRYSIRGLAGDITIRDVSGNPTDIAGNVWCVIDSTNHNIADEVLNINVSAYNSKRDWKKGAARIEVGGRPIVYTLSNKLLMQQGQDVFSGDGSTTEFVSTKTLANAYATRESLSLNRFLHVDVDGNVLREGQDYTLTLNEDAVTYTVTLNTPPSEGRNNVKLKRMLPLYDMFLRQNLVLAEGASELLQCYSFLKTIDGTAYWDPYGISFASFTEDDAE